MPTRKIIDGAKSFEKSLGRRDRFRPKIVEIGDILAIFEPFEVLKIHMPLFGDFGRASRDLYRNLFTNRTFPGTFVSILRKVAGSILGQLWLLGHDMMVW